MQIKVKPEKLDWLDAWCGYVPTTYAHRAGVAPAQKLAVVRASMPINAGCNEIRLACTEQHGAPAESAAGHGARGLRWRRGMKLRSLSVVASCAVALLATAIPGQAAVDFFNPAVSSFAGITTGWYHHQQLWYDSST